ncbi:MAG: anaerobic ribonucleoside-triphosphate reductase [Cetobacterium sp.]
MLVVKKDGRVVRFDFTKIVKAVKKSADRIGVDLSEQKVEKLKDIILSELRGLEQISVKRIHEIVEMSIYKVDVRISNSYCSFRNWKKEQAELMETVTIGVNKSMDERDRSNSNLNSALFSSKRTNVSKILLREMFLKYFLMDSERDASKCGYIYPHDMDNRLIGTHNCCVVDAENIMGNGFNINGFFCKEPKNIVNAVGVLGDIIITASSAQYGGYSVREVDTTLSKYCKKSYEYWVDIFKELGLEEQDVKNRAILNVKKELKDSLQGLEFQINTRESSRGDYPFITLTFGKDTEYWARVVSSTILEVRREGHGGKVKQKMIFPKLVYIVREDGYNEDILEEAISTSVVSLYPDYINTKTASPMGK